MLIVACYDFFKPVLPMKPAAILTYLFIATASTAASFAQELDVDWKLYGGAKIGGVDDACFYDAKGVAQGPENHLRVWTKCIGIQSLNDVDTKNGPNQKIIENAAQKIAHGYVPPIIVAGSVEFQSIPDITAMEEIADIANIQPHGRILYEIDCANQMLRELSIAIQVGGKTGSSSKPGDWKYISPETNAATLSKILCRR
jgi:hypothetical protein